jgi:apolipoprotein N-acyltransferase
LVTPGLSAAFDYQGRQLAAMDHYQTPDYVMISEVPTKGVRTIYSRLGNWFAWVCVAGSLVLIGRAVSTHRKHSSVPHQQISCDKEEEHY